MAAAENPWVWQSVQATLTWAPTRGKMDFEWSKDAGFQAAGVWHWAQSWPNWPRWASSLAWQPEQVVGIAAMAALEKPWVWQSLQATVVWAPVSGKADLAWSKVAGCQAAVEWHSEQSWPNWPWWGSSLEWQSLHIAGVDASPAAEDAWVWQPVQGTLICAPVN